MPDCFTSTSWTQTHHKDGDKLLLHRLSFKNRAASFTEELLLEADHHVFRGSLSGNLPEIFWKIPVGRRDYDEEYDLLNNSVASIMFDWFNRTLNRLDRLATGELVHEVDISPERVARLWPEMDWLILKEDDAGS